MTLPQIAINVLISLVVLMAGCWPAADLGSSPQRFAPLLIVGVATAHCRHALLRMTQDLAHGESFDADTRHVAGSRAAQVTEAK